MITKDNADHFSKYQQIYWVSLPGGSLTLICSRPGEAGGFENHPYKTTIRERLLQIGNCKNGHFADFLTINSKIMKELNFEQMEKVQGGNYYCAMICHWLTGGSGYQGDIFDLYLAWANNCTAYCSI